MSNVNLKQVASEVGLSITTVSQILRSAPGFSYRPETVARVKEAVQKLGYEPNGAARMLRQKTSKLIGLAIDFRATYQNPLATEIYNAVADRGYQPILIETRSPAVEGSLFPSLNLLAGIIGIDTHLMDDLPDLYERMQLRLPLVLTIPVRSKSIDYIATDRRKLVSFAVEHLARLGHRRILYALTGGEGVITEMKLEGWRQALRDNGLDANCATLFRDLKGDKLDAIGESVAAAVLAVRPTPSALICSGDEVAVAAMSAFARRGWKTPGRISIVAQSSSGYDISSYPQLTVVVPPLARIAAMAAQRLIERIEIDASETEIKHVHQLIEPTLIVRESTAPPIEC